MKRTDPIRRRRRARRLHRLTLILVALLAAGCGSYKRFLYEGFGRDGWQKPEQVVSALELERGDRIADLGSGGGYFTFRLADAVGPGGTVYAVDVDAALTEYVSERARDEGRDNVEVVLAVYDDPLIPEPPVDLIFTCNTYHHIEDRVSYFARARRYLRPGGRVAVIDYDGEGWLQRWFGHATPSDQIREEMEAAGYRLLASHDFLERQHFLVFAAPEGNAPGP